MISLFLNTSSNYFNACLAKDNQVIASILKKYDRDLSKEALFEITEMIKNEGLTPENIDEIICVRGPGSFTGLRVGVTIAKTMAYFLNKPLYSVSSLDVMATSVESDIIIPIIDARRDYVYGAIYDKDYNVLMKECYIKLDELLKTVNSYQGKKVFVSYDKFDFETINPNPNLDNLLKQNFKIKEDSLNFIPTYLKRPEAEEKLNDNRN